MRKFVLFSEDNQRGRVTSTALDFQFICVSFCMLVANLCQFLMGISTNNHWVTKLLTLWTLFWFPDPEQLRGAMSLASWWAAESPSPSHGQSIKLPAHVAGELSFYISVDTDAVLACLFVCVHVCACVRRYFTGGTWAHWTVAWCSFNEFFSTQAQARLMNILRLN